MSMADELNKITVYMPGTTQAFRTWAAGEIHDKYPSAHVVHILDEISPYHCHIDIEGPEDVELITEIFEFTAKLRELYHDL